MNDVTAERWLPVVGYEGFYEVSDLGRVRSLDRYEQITGPKAGVRRRRGRIMSLFVMPSTGYLCVRLSKHDKQTTWGVHVLVLTAFDRPCPEGMECRHLNGDRTDARLAYLAWGTRSENTLDQVTHGTHRNSRKTKCLMGHDYDYIVPTTGRRQCSQCKRDNAITRASAPGDRRRREFKREVRDERPDQQGIPEDGEAA